MQPLDRTSWEVLNATADDCENLEQIYRMVCLEFSVEAYKQHAYCLRPAPGAPSLEELANRIRELVDAGLLTAVMDDNGEPLRDLADASFVWRAWFAMSPAGRTAWEASEHAAAV